MPYFIFRIVQVNFLSRLSNLRELALSVFGQVKAVLTLINTVVIAHNNWI